MVARRRRNRTWVVFSNIFYVAYGRSPSVGGVSLLRVGTVLRLERVAWSMVN